MKLNNKYTIVIPGTVDNKKRDYESVLKVFNDINHDYSLILLGKMNDSEIRSKIIKNKNIQWFDNFVPQQIFDEHLKNSDLILAPTFQKYNWGTSALEFYGVTKASGAEFDCLKYKKLLLINDFYKVDTFLTENCIVYNFSDMDDLKKQLNQLINNKRDNKDIVQNIELFNNDLKHKFITEWN